MKHFIFLFAITLYVSVVTAQQNTFSKVLFNIDENIQGYSVDSFYDGGYIIAGDDWWNTEAGFILKVDSLGDIEWNRIISDKYNTNNSIRFNQVISTYDSSLFVIGDIYFQDIQKNKGIFLKINRNGNIIWSRTIEGTNNFYLNSVDQTSDSGFIVTGKSRVWDSRDLVEKVIVLKLDKYANFSWIYKFDSGDENNYKGYSVKQINDTNYLVSGYNYWSPGYSFLMKLSSNGSLIWAKRFYMNGSYSECYILDFLMNDEGIVLYANLNGKPALIQTDSAGNIEWTKRYTLFIDLWSGLINLKLHKTSDNGFVFVSGDEYSDGVLIKTDSVGNPLFADELEIGVVDVLETVSKDFFITGIGPLAGITSKNYVSGEIGFIQIDSLGNGGECGWNITATVENDTVLTEPISFTSTSSCTISSISVDVDSITINYREGCVDIPWGVNENKNKMGIEVFPNPSHGEVTVSLKNEISGIFEVFNNNGQIVVKQMLINPQTDIRINNPVQGVYFYRFTNNERKVVRGKIVIY